MTTPANFGDSELADAIDAAWDGIEAQASPIWLDNMANLFRYIGLNVIEVDGWQRRSRSNNSGYSRKPTHVMVHHTASNTSAENDVNYMTFNADVAPIANCYFARNGDVHVMAGGPTNTNGSGSDTWGGGVPNDSMNSYAVGFEIGNNGTGETYPAAQLNAVYKACAATLVALGEDVGHLRSHFEWSPGRKVDPAGPPLDTAATPGIQWDMDAFRGTVWSIIDNGDLPDNPPPTEPPVDPPPGYNPPTVWSPYHEDCNKPVVRNGDRNEYVRYLQDALVLTSEFDIHRDGIFGSETLTAVQEFQRYHGVDDDGTVGYNGPDCQNAGVHATWPLIDMMVSHPPPPEKPPEPPPGGPITGVEPTADAIYYVRSGDSPWAAGERIWGSGVRGADELPVSMFAQPDVVVRVTAVPGVWTLVQPGDSPWSLTETLGGNPATDLDRFYDFNGPESRVLQPGEPVYLPADL